MYIDPVVLLLLLILMVLVVRQVFYRVTRWLASVIIFLLIMAVLLPHQTKGLFAAVYGLLVEAVHRIPYVFQ
jgi:hypothetical protein